MGTKKPHLVPHPGAFVVAAIALFAAHAHAADSTATHAAPPAAPAATPAAPAATPAAPGAAPSAAAGTTPAKDASAVPQTADEEYDLKMRELEDNVSELKEQIFRSKAKLQLLAEQVAGGVGTGAKIIIVHKNEMTPANFLLTEASYYLDGQPLWQEVDEVGSKLTDKKDFPVWDGNIVEGSHTLTVKLTYKGNGTGVFKYLSAYTWHLKDAITFTAEPGKVVTINSVGFEKGNFTTPLEERPAIRFDVNISRDAKPEPKEGAGGAPVSDATGTNPASSSSSPSSSPASAGGSKPKAP